MIFLFEKTNSTYLGIHNVSAFTMGNTKDNPQSLVSESLSEWAL